MNRPILTVMLQARTPERLFALIEQGILGGAEGFGLQLEQLEPKYHTPEVFREIFARIGDLPCYVTNYRWNLNEGKSDREVADELLSVADFGGTLFDVMGDTFCPSPDQITYDEAAIDAQKELIDALHAKGKRVLVSSHTYRYMPYDEVYPIVRAQKERGADVAKIVTAANSAEEESVAFEISARLKRELGIEFLFLCGGTHCALHRKLAPCYAGGMLLCVVAHDEFSTPAQPLLAYAKQIIHTIYGGT